MQGSAFYPVKIVSRTVTRKRARRMLWTVMSAAFGLGCACTLSPALSPAAWITARNAPTTAPVVAQADIPSVVPVLAMANVTPPVAVPAPVPAPAVASTPPVAPVAIASVAPVPVAAAPPAPVTVAATIAPKPAYPVSRNLKVENGDTLAGLLTDTGLPGDEAQHAVEAIKHVYDPRKLDAGQTVAVKLDSAPGAPQTPILASLTLPLSPTQTLQVTRSRDATFSVKKIDAQIERKLARAGGRIDSSLYETGVDSGVPPALLNELIGAYSYDVDFQRDIKQGDAMDVLFERLQTKEGVVTGHGNVIYAELDLGDRELKLYRYVDKSGSADYYNAQGESIRKALLRTPINGARITSGYGMRMHPLLGYTKMHRGIDFGAPIGTPIYAAGDGVVDFIGKKGGYGNYLRIKHNGTYSSAYGHISRFASGLAPGSKVHQGQIVAYVGMTGMATGPHLHYEILVNDEQVNPANVKFKTGNVLQGKELLAFHKTIAQIDARLASLPHNTVVAMNDTPKKKAED